MFRFLTVLMSAILLLGSFSVSAEDAVDSYKVGDLLPPITLNDQHDKPHTLSADTRVLLYTTGMKGGGVIRDILDKGEADYLPSRHAMFISNISGMPKIIAATIGLPRMRSHDYSIVLDKTGDSTSRLPAEDNSATIIYLNDGTITGIEFTKDSDKVREAVESAAK